MSVRAELGRAALAILSDARGAPELPPAWVGSISHKEHLAVALAAPAGTARLGIDLEDRAPLRRAFAKRILSSAERVMLESLCDDDLGHELTVRFSLKEAIYKALDPFLRRHIAFAEVTIQGRQRGPFVPVLALQESEGAFDVAVSLAECCRYWLSTSRVRALAKEHGEGDLSVHHEPLRN